MDTDTPIWDLRTNHQRLADHVELSGAKAVDVGSGAGGLVRFMRSAGADAIGIECGEAMITQARAEDPEHVDSYIEGVGQDLPLDDDSVDLVVFSYSLHHVPINEMAAALREAARVTRPGGRLAVLEPIPEGPGFETHRLIDDETIVRAAAQAALNTDLPDVFTQTDEVHYSASYSYTDVAELEQTVVDIDPTRRVAFDAVRYEIAERFYANSEKHGGRYWFEQPVVLRIFEKS